MVALFCLFLALFVSPFKSCAWMRLIDTIVERLGEAIDAATARIS
jgi:hypothetical protein